MSSYLGSLPLLCLFQGRGCLGHGREPHGERGADTGLRADANRAAMALDDVPRDRQAESRPATARPRPIGLVETLEDPRLVLRLDAGAVVLDPGDDDVGGRGGASG